MSDFAADSQPVVTLNASRLIECVLFTAVEDAALEAEEQFRVALSPGEPSVVSTGSSTVTVIDNDSKLWHC